MTAWSLRYDHFDPRRQGLREALCTLGNGCFATRGAAEEATADEIHYPGTYLAGGYNRLQSTVAGRAVGSEDLVNFPNWLPLRFRPQDGDWFNLLGVQILSYRQELEMYSGVLTRSLRVRDHQHREFTLTSRRLVHMEQPHVAAIEYSLTAENWSGLVQVQSALDGSVINAGVARYRALNSKHLRLLDTGHAGQDIVYLLVQTTQSRVQVAQAARTRVYRGEDPYDPACTTFRHQSIVGQELMLELRQGESLTVEKVVALYSSRDRAISEPLYEAQQALLGCGRFRDLLESHARAWKYLWRKYDVVIDAPANEQRVLRLHIFHLLQSVSAHTIGLDVGVPARGLHGEAYRGHIFWDELFIFPFYTFRIPEITRSLLLYRYRRLDMARRLAREEGYVGAMYPWQSGSNGEEETQLMHLNPRSGTWGPDLSRRQRHVNIAIVYNAWQYFMHTGDREFMDVYGTEMVLEIARFWSSIAQYNSETRRYEIDGVMGPDEYHEKYPDRDAGGLKNNAYTNLMVVWVLERALALLELLPPERRHELNERLGLSTEELDRWVDITRKMTVPFHGDGIVSQFEGYDKLAAFDWQGYQRKYGDIERLDRILKAEGDSPDRYQVSKQADVLMLFYLLPPKELRRLFEQLGYKFDDDMVARNVAYYLQRTSHGSTLSKVVHASVLDRIDRSAAWAMFCAALASDIADVQDGTTPEGIHLGAMAGTVDIVLRHYAGIDTTSEVIAFYPRLPEHVRGLRLRLRHRGQWYELEIGTKRATLRVDADGRGPIMVNIAGKLRKLVPGATHEFALRARPGRAKLAVAGRKSRPAKKAAGARRQ
jgi:trehalose/maltose hydrolase-like predicted phosphorylase